MLGRIDCLLFFVAFLPARFALAQAPSFEKSNSPIADSLIGIYRITMGPTDRLYTGSEYIGFVKRPKGHPFFETDELKPAQILYEGVLYSVDILYDLVDDAVILKNYDQAFSIKLVNEKVRSFNFS